jgi:hypothetical protein
VPWTSNVSARIVALIPVIVSPIGRRTMHRAETSVPCDDGYVLGLQGRAMVANTQTQDLSGLQQRALALESHAEARTQAYQRATWIRFVGVFFPIPFVVVLLRLEMAAWTYYVWGGLIILGGAVLYVIDTAASTRVDEAVEAAATARKAYEEAAQGGVTPP